MTPSQFQTLQSWYHASADASGPRQAELLAQYHAVDPALADRLRLMLAAADDSRLLQPAVSLPPEARAPRCVQTVPDQIGPYRLGQVLGEGAFGIVYRAEQSSPVVRSVAIKVLLSGIRDPRIVTRFEAERQVLAALDHQNIAKVLDAGTLPDGRPYFVMEFVRGEPITEYADRHHLDTRDRLELIEQVCRAVQHAHGAGVIHRDLKPTNLLVESRDGAPFCRVIDFGVAKLLQDSPARPATAIGEPTEVRTFIGTPAYVSPEQARGAALIDIRADVYSLGAVLYELLTGDTPVPRQALRSADHLDILRLICETPIQPPSIRSRQSPRHAPGASGLRGELDALVIKALERDAGKRYATADALAADIRRHLDGQPVEATDPTTIYLVTKFIRRNRAATVGVTATVLALAAGLGTTSVMMVRYRDQKSLAEQRERREVAERRKAETAESGLRKLAEQYIDVFRAIDPSIAMGRDTRLIRDMIDVADRKLVRGDFQDVPAAEMRLTNALGQMHQRLGDLERAEPLYDRTIALARQYLTPKDPFLATAINDLAAFREVQGRYEEAKALYAESIALARAQPDNRSVLSYALGNLALLLIKSGEDQRAEPMLVEALNIQRDLRTDGDSYLSTALNNIGGLYLTRNDFEQARRFFTEGLQTLDASIPFDHPLRVTLLTNIALCDMNTGKVQEAIEPLSTAVDVGRRVTPDGSPDLATALDTLGMARLNTGQPDLAEPLAMEALGMRRKRGGPDDHYVASTLNNLAMTKQALRKVDEAEPLYRECLTLRRSLYPGGHAEVADSLGNLGSLLFTQARFAEARPLLQENLDLNLKFRGPDDPQVAVALNNLGLCLVNLGRYDDAQPFLVRSVDLRRKLFPPDSPPVLNAEVQLAHNSLRVGQPALAAETYRALWDLRRSIKDSPRDLLYEAAFSLADALVEQSLSPDPAPADQRLAWLTETDDLLRQVEQAVGPQPLDSWRTDQTRALRAAASMARVEVSPTLPADQRLESLRRAEPDLRAGLSSIDRAQNMAKPLADLRRALARNRLRHMATLWDQLQPGAGKLAAVEAEFTR